MKKKWRKTFFVVVYVQHCCDAVRETSAVMPSVVAVVSWCLGPRPATPVGVNVQTWQVSRLRASSLYFLRLTFSYVSLCGRTIGHLTVGDFAVTGVQLFLFAFLLSTREMDGKAEGRWLATSPCIYKISITRRTNAIRAYEEKSSELTPPGPRSRVDTIQLSWVGSADSTT